LEFGDLARWIVDILVLVAVATTALLARQYLPAYVKEKGKNLATREDIAGITREIESVKTDYTHQLELLRDQLERARAMDAARRDRVVSHLDGVLQSYAELAVVLALSGRSAWTNSVDLTVAEERCWTAIEKLLANLNVLLFLKAIPRDVALEVAASCSAARDAWDNVFFCLGEARRIDALEDDKDTRGFARTNYQELKKHAADLHKARLRLFDAVTSLPSRTSDVVPTEYSGPRNLDSVISYTWEPNRGGPSGTHTQAVSAGL